MKITTFRLSLAIVIAMFFLWSIGYLPVVVKTSSSPGAAEITINGTARGATPFYTFLLPGEHLVEGRVNHEDGVYYYAASQIQVDRSFFQKIEIKLSKSEFRSPALGAKFMYIAPGKVTDIPYLDEYQKGKKYNLAIPQGIFIQATEVTQRQWKKIMGGGRTPVQAVDCPDCPPVIRSGNPSYVADCPDCPVVLVSWYVVQRFIAKLNKAEKTSKYRLPTAAEWEYAARAGTTTPYAFGNCLDATMANCGGDAQLDCTDDKGGWNVSTEYRQKALPVAGFTPNSWGLYDMHGNVWEWTHKMDTDFKIAKGGSWNSTAENCGSVSAVGFTPEDGFNDVGFRLIRGDNPGSS